MSHRVDRVTPLSSRDINTATVAPSARRRSAIAVRAAIFCFLLGMALCGWFLFDGPVAVYTLNHKHPEMLVELLAVAEAFGNGISVIMIVALIWRLDPSNLRSVPRLLVMSFGAGIAADTVKLMVGRWRPISGQFDPADMSSTFAGWFPLFSLSSAEQSFPSAHTATAVGLALALAWIYPHGRILFLGGAVLVAVQRVTYGSHFVSDVCAGAAVGWLVATGTLYSPRLDRLFRWIETPRDAGCDPQSLAEIRLRTEVIPVPPAPREGQGTNAAQHSTAANHRTVAPGVPIAKHTVRE